jgi:hypothetical protein
MATRRTLALKTREQRELEHYRDHDPRPYVRERCGAVLKIADGDTPHAVATQGLLKPRDPDTVYGWLQLYESEGVAALVVHQHGGNRRRSLRGVRCHARGIVGDAAGRTG